MSSEAQEIKKLTAEVARLIDLIEKVYYLMPGASERETELDPANLGDPPEPPVVKRGRGRPPKDSGPQG